MESNSAARTRTRTQTRQLELELEAALYFGLQRALGLDLESQASLSFRCTSSQVTEARTGAVRAGVVAKPSPLGDEMGEFEGGWAMSPDAGNPSFPRAIPHGMLIID